MTINQINWPTWPQYGIVEKTAVERVIRSNQLFADKEVRDFEDEFANYVGVKYAIGVGNATQGLHLSLAALNIGVSDEVIVTPYTWISSASCIVMQNAVPRFVDIDAATLSLSPVAVEEAINPLTRAIMHVHLFGYTSRVTAIRTIADKHGLFLVEDASHAHGLIIDGKRAGSFGDISVFSLHQRKAISVGDGGVICTNNAEVADKIRRLRSFGDAELSYNYRMTEFAGALGKVGLARLDQDNKERAWAAKYLAHKLEGHPWLKVRLSAEGEDSVYHAVLLETASDGPSSEQLSDFLVSEGVSAKKTWSPLHRHPHFNHSHEPARGYPWKHPKYQGLMRNKKYANVDLPVTESLVPHQVTELYAHPGITRTQLDSVSNLLWDYKK